MQRSHIPGALEAWDGDVRIPEKAQGRLFERLGPPRGDVAFRLAVDVSVEGEAAVG